MLRITAVNGSEIKLGRIIRLASGARLTLNENGVFSYSLILLLRARQQ